MTIVVTVKNQNDLQRFQENLRTLRINLQAFKKQRTKEIVEEITLSQIHSRMRAANFSPKIIENTLVADVILVGQTDFRIVIVSELFSPLGFDIAEAREKGTSRHRVEPSDEDGVLAWVEDGTVKFSKGHEVEGMQALRIIARTVQETTPLVMGRWEREQREFIAKTVQGEAVG